MSIKTKDFPKLKKNICIRCWCCAEVCPQNAIDKSKRPFIGRLVLKTDKNKKR
jgi:formate hydrogenlyase subunit 6/NADH:ubiquinone oxidoreductase subunit I